MQIGEHRQLANRLRAEIRTRGSTDNPYCIGVHTSLWVQRDDRKYPVFLCDDDHGGVDADLIRRLAVIINKSLEPTGEMHVPGRG